VLGSSPSGTLLRPGPHSGGGGAPGDPPGGPDMSPRELWTGTHRGLVFLCGGPDPMVLPGMYYPSSLRGALRPVHVVGSGAALRVTWRCCTGIVSPYFRRGYP
jgi:hypothetical protein